MLVFKTNKHNTEMQKLLNLKITALTCICINVQFIRVNVLLFFILSFIIDD